VAQCQERQTLLAKENERLREAMVVMVEGAIGTYGDNFKKTPRVQRWRAGSFEMCVFLFKIFYDGKQTGVAIGFKYFLQ